MLYCAVHATPTALSQLLLNLAHKKQTKKNLNHFCCNIDVIYKRENTNCIAPYKRFQLYTCNLVHLSACKMFSLALNLTLQQCRSISLDGTYIRTRWASASGRWEIKSLYWWDWNRQENGSHWKINKRIVFLITLACSDIVRLHAAQWLVFTERVGTCTCMHNDHSTCTCTCMHNDPNTCTCTCMHNDHNTCTCTCRCQTMGGKCPMQVQFPAIQRL